MRRWRSSGRLWRCAAVVLAVVAVIAGGLAAGPAGTAVAAQGGSRPAVSLGPASRGAGTLAPRPARAAVFKAAVPSGTTWPAAGTAVAAAVPVRPAPAQPGVRAAASLWALPSLSPGSQAGRLPLSAATAGGAMRGVRFSVAAHAAATAAGIRGLLFTAAAVGGAGKVRVSVDYAQFASAYGGGFGASLGLAELPACALTTPRIAACHKITRISSINNTTAQSVSAAVSLPGAAGQAVSAAASPATAGQAVVLAVLAAPQDGGGATGNYQATKLTPASTWSAGGSSGDFTYSYPVTLPPAPGGLTPDLTLGYDSGTADAQTAQDQPQASWLGEGWSLPQASITQSFTACADNPEGSAAAELTQDACYDGPVLNLTLNGQSTALVCPSPFSYTAASTCYAADHSGAVITHHVGSGNGQGTQFTDYWTVTTRDGSTYYFGLNHLPGWVSGDSTTNSADWEPVFSAHSGDPCYHLKAATFAGSACPMAYQWNLDYVTNSFGSAMAYFYAQAINAYDEYGQSTAQGYVRDSYLSKIVYGFTGGNAYSTATATAPADEVSFTTGTRCFAAASSCTPLNATTAPNWLDVPYNLICAAGSTCTSAAGYGPTFFSTVALASMTTYQRTGTATTPTTPVDQWAFSQGFPALPKGDTADVPTLTLNSITRTAEDATSGATAGSAVAFPAESFSYQMLQNQLDPGTAPWMSRPRLLQVTTETGSQIKVSYTEPDPCPVSTAPVSPSANHLSCFPVYWGLFQPDTTGGDYGYPDWFIKYAVQSVQQTDPSGGSAGLYTAYDYAGPAWHYDDNEVVEAKERTYGQWRGYQKVYTLAGNGSDPQAETETDYYQGMSDDNNTTAVSVTDSQGAAHDDTNQLAGNALETTAYDYATTWPAVPPQSAVDHSSIYSYWISGAVASRTRSGLPALTASASGVTEQWNRQALTDGGTTTWRDTATDTTYFSATSADPELGLPEYAYSLGDLSQLGSPTEETCTTTSYTANTTANIVLPAEIQVAAVPCGGTSSGTSSAPSSAADNGLTAPSGVSAANIVSDARTFYNNPTLAGTWPQPASSTLAWPQAAPANTCASVVQNLSGDTGGTLTYQTASAQTCNSYGQVTASWDGNGGHNPATGKYAATTTAYTLTDGSDTAQTVTNPLGQATITTDDPARGLPVKTTDPNGIITTLQYDEAGRLTSRWNNSRATTAVASYAYSYAFGTATTPSVVTEKQLNDAGATITSTALYDALLRPRQTQYPTPQGGIMVADHFYDSRGWEWKTNNSWWDTGANPGSTVLTIADSQVPDQTVTGYDALGRAVKVTSYDDSTVKAIAYTQYTGDKVITIPAATAAGTPQGGTPAVTVTDAAGRTTETDTYTAWPSLSAGTNSGGFPAVSVTGGTTQPVTYAYNTNDLQSAVTAAGEQWTTAYNLLGQVTSSTAPNSGATTGMTYDADGNRTQSTDADGNTITQTYDPLGRKTGEYAGTSAAAPPIATWAYDNSNGAVASMADPVGHLTTETSYDHNGSAFTTQQSGFNVFGESTGQSVTVPADQGSLAGTYTQARLYSSTTGLPLKMTYPASPAFSGTTALPAETVSTGYQTGLDLPAAVSGLAGYTANITWTAWTQPGQEELGTSSVNAFITNTFDPNTGRLTDSQVQNTAVSTSNPYDNTAYTYDAAGGITAQSDTRWTPAGGTQGEQQCYSYNTAGELTQAWTTATATACSSGPSTGSGGTVADGIPGGAYWTQWTYSPLGDQATETDTPPAGGTATVTAYTYNNGHGTGSGQPDTLTGSAMTGGASGSGAWTYDPAGNTASQALTSGGTSSGECYAYTAAGKLSAAWAGSAPCPASPPAGTGTSYVYDGEGNMLAVDGPSGDTIYILGEQITAALSGGTVTGITGIRFIPLPGGGQVVRTGAGTSYGYETADQHGTSVLTLGNTLQNPVWRQFTPYGAPRGTATGTWPDSNGYLGDPAIAADGLTAIGARQYNPATGRFITPDPVLEAGALAQMGGYAYAADNPVSDSDPTGLCPKDICGDNINEPTTQTVTPSSGSGGEGSGTAATAPAPAEVACNSVASRFAAGPCSVPAPSPAGTGNGLDLLAGWGSDLAGLLDQGYCAANPAGCVLSYLGVGTPMPSQYYMNFITSQGIDTSSGAYHAGIITGDLLLIAAGGAAGAAADGLAATAEEAQTAADVPAFARSQYGRMTSAQRAGALAKSPTCPYCGVSPSTQADHINALKQDWQSGGWNDDFATRTGRVNDPGNLIGACQSCNASKGARLLGPGVGEWWPPGWPAGIWWPFGGP